MSGFENKRCWRRAVAVLVAYALLLHTFLVGLAAAHASTGIDAPVLWGQSLCMSGSSADDAIPGDTGALKVHCVHCVLCPDGQFLAGADAPSVAHPLPAVVAVRSILPDAPTRSLRVGWNRTRAPPR
jgi:hypothetical protein